MIFISSVSKNLYPFLPQYNWTLHCAIQVIPGVSHLNETDFHSLRVSGSQVAGHQNPGKFVNPHERANHPNL